MANDAPDEVQRWTAKRRVALVVSILKGETSVQQAAEPHHSLGHVPPLASGSSSVLAPGADGGVLRRNHCPGDCQKQHCFWFFNRNS